MNGLTEIHSAREQAAAALQRSHTPVIIIPRNPSSDALAAGLALLLVLEKLGQNARLVCPQFSLPPSHSFLPKSQSIFTDLSSLRTFIISVNTKQVKLEALSYAMENDRVNIHLTPKNGYFEARDVTTSDGTFAYDAIVTLDTPQLEQLGDLYHQNVEFFYQVPIINIDHHAANRRYGHINTVDITATSVSEIVFEILRHLGLEHLDEQVATSLLTGIISKTKAFQSQSVTPRSLSIASHLISAGGRRDEIIRHLYQTKSLAILRLWGRTLVNIRETAGGQIVWSTLTRADLRDSQAQPDEAAGVLDELMINTPRAKYGLIFVDDGRRTAVYGNHAPEVTPPKLPPTIKIRTPQYFSGHIDQPLAVTSQQIVKLFADHLSD